MALNKHIKNLDKDGVVRFAAVPEAAWAWATAQIAEARKGVLLLVVPEALRVEKLVDSLRALLPEREVLGFAAPDVNPYDALSPAPEVMAGRLAVMQALQAGKTPVLVAGVHALSWRLPRDVAPPLSLSVGDVLPPDELARKLVAMGLVRKDQVHEVGDWAQRGGVIDIWCTGEGPVRLEFFDDEIERLVRFDAASQRSLAPLEQVELGQAVAVRLEAARVETFRQNYRAMFDGGSGDVAYAQVTEGVMPAHAAQLLPLFWDEPLPGLTDLLPKATTVVMPEGVEAHAMAWDDLVGEAYAARKADEGQGGDVVRAVLPERLMMPAPQMMKVLAGHPRVELAAFDDSGAAVRLGLRGHGMFGPAGNRHAAAQMAAKEVAGKVAEGYRVVLTAPSPAGLNILLKALEGEGAPTATLTNDLPAALEGKGGLLALVAPLAEGWVAPQQGLMVLTEGDVFGARLGHGGTSRPRRKKSAEELIAHFSELVDGDYVVHEDHGIGRFAGLVTMDIGGRKQDFLKVLYAGDDRLFVPVDSLAVLSRYKGADAGAVQVDKLGGTGWQARKAKVREDLMAMADELLKTAAARQLTAREPLAGEGGASLYAEFCAGFPYDLTEDQQRVMEEVEEDFAAHHPMDRLVVGDVGFGKTEVALRAAYLAAAAGKQVAVVCPTTLLARQHFTNFNERFGGFPMQVGRLSRLVSAAETTSTKKRLAEGTVDIVVGTHALLGKDIKFKNLGLVIVDEEQRFGVAHKERLKQLRANVDVLTLTATPIPRTLQMAVGGVRSLSLITTPPVDRQAVATFVLGWDNKTLAEAVKREIGRGGQVYVVAPHVEDLAKLADSLHGLVPNLRLGVAHGQMPEGELEQVMGAFYEGELQVLVATTIIESGLDVPNANTLIVYRADRFGLAQLYQLRGRVGRSQRRAYAYLLLPEGGLTPEAVKRLTILQRLTELGAGFTLASYDMDLRGFGNLLGKQQSGNIRDIGFELYNKMLREAVDERSKLKGREIVSDTPDELPTASVQLKLGVSYLIPDSYVTDVAQRLQLYRRLATLKDAEALEDFKAELADRYGAVPPEVDALLAVMGLRTRAERLNVAKVEVGEKGVAVAFHAGRFANPAGLMKYIMGHAGVVSVRPDQSLVWHRHGGDDRLVLEGVGKILAALEGCL